MKNLLAFVPLICLVHFNTAAAADWITEPSYYTHDPTSGQRVRQYSPIGPFYTYQRRDFKRSGFRHTRSSLQVGNSADHYHLTEEWGKPVRPYGEWRFPYRPYSVPYDAWGPLFPGRGGFRGFRGGFRRPVPHAGIRRDPSASHHGHGDVQQDLEPGFNNRQQLLDGRYPPFDELDPFERKQVLDHIFPKSTPPDEDD